MLIQLPTTSQNVVFNQCSLCQWMTTLTIHWQKTEIYLPTFIFLSHQFMHQVLLVLLPKSLSLIILLFSISISTLSGSNWPSVQPDGLLTALDTASLAPFPISSSSRSQSSIKSWPMFKSYWYLPIAGMLLVGFLFSVYFLLIKPHVAFYSHLLSILKISFIVYLVYSEVCNIS